MPHGFRHMASTRLHTLGQPDHVIEQQLSHQKRGKVARVYDKSKYMPERRKLMDFWAEELELLRKGKSHEDNAE